MHIAHHLHPIQQQQQHLLLLQLCCELMCLMLKGSRVCKTQGRSYPPPPQMEYCVCVRVYEFLKSWNSNCRCKPALQLQAQAASLDTQGLGRRTKCPIKGDPYRQTTTKMAAMLRYVQLFGINKLRFRPGILKIFLFFQSAVQNL